mgnify:FL=1
MDKFGLLGGKLGHSLSPAIHKLFFKYTDKEGTYDLLETEVEKISSRMEELRKNFKGANVTIPHKLHVMPFLDGISEEAKAIGAVNTIKFTPEGAFGYNTDYFGFARMLEYNKIFAKGKACAVLGTGGAARAVVKYLATAAASKIYLVTRDVTKDYGDFKKMAPGLEIISYEELEKLSGYCLINCTPLGMFPKMDACPVSQEVSANFEVSVDAIYNPAETIFLKQAKLSGKQAVNGLFMLVAQAVAAQELWQEEKYSSELIVKIMGDLEQSL